MVEDLRVLQREGDDGVGSMRVDNKDVFVATAGRLREGASEVSRHATGLNQPDSRVRHG